MATDRSLRIVVAGVGCYVGGCLALAGRDVTLLLRPALAEAIARYGLTISDLGGADRVPAPSAVRLATEPAAAFADGGIVLVTEIDHLQGAILGLAAKTRVRVPLTQRIVRLVKEAEAARAGSPRLTPGSPRNSRPWLRSDAPTAA